jgi:hypothetical protein
MVDQGKVEDKKQEEGDKMEVEAKAPDSSE